MSSGAPGEPGAGAPGHKERGRSFASRPLDGSDGDESLRLGPFRVTRELTRAPGAWIVEARTEDNRPVLLQLAHLRPPRVAEESVEQADYVRMIGSATAHLAGDAESSALHHDAESYADGSRILYWALPWVEGAHRLGHARTLIASGQALLQIALSLLERLRVRHERGRLEPLLSEQLILVLPDGSATLLGIPIHLPQEWLADDMIPARLAPEEKSGQEPRRTGDLWRLGQSLKVIAAELELLPQDLRHVLDRLVEPDSTRRISSATEALSEFRALSTQAKSWSTPGMVLPPSPSQDGVLAPAPDAQNTIGVEPRSFSHVARDLEPPSEPDVPNARSVSSLDGDSKDHAPLSAPSLPDEDSAPTWEPRENATQRVALREDKSGPSPVVAPPSAPPRVVNIPEAPTVLDLNPTIRHHMVARPAHQQGPVIPYASTLVDEDRPAEVPEPVAKRPIEAPSNIQARRDGSSEATIRDLPRRALEDAGESPTIDDASLRRSGAKPPTPAPKSPAPQAPSTQAPSSAQPSPSRSNAWDRAKVASGANPILPFGPQGTVVGVRLIDNPTGMRRAPELAGAAGLLPPPPIATSGPPEPPAQSGAGTPRPAIDGGGGLMPRALDALVPYDPGEQRPRTPRPDVRRSGEVAQPAMRRSGEVNAPASDAPRAAPPVPVAPARSKGVVLGALAFFFAGGVAALVAPYLLPAKELPKPPPVVAPPPPSTPEIGEVIIPAIGDVILKSDPEEATVVSEEDGRILGTTPLRFMVPPGGAAVLVTAAAFEPQRLVLPDRGRVTAELLEIQDDRPCDLSLTVPGDRELSGVASSIEVDTAYTVRGAAVLRTSDGNGAWIVRCPSLGGGEKQTLPPRSGSAMHELEILAPLDASVSIDGVELGKVPQSKKISAKFALVKIELEKGVSLERWVPVSADTKLRLPKPKKKKIEEPEPPPPPTRGKDPKDGKKKKG